MEQERLVSVDKMSCSRTQSSRKSTAKESRGSFLPRLYKRLSVILELPRPECYLQQVHLNQNHLRPRAVIMMITTLSLMKELKRKSQKRQLPESQKQWMLIHPTIITNQVLLSK
uniref:Uncharacterized protein n=1 Tax=Cacopsylla melanoneura TaxID=428564 RepID=A0A8D8LEF0_9HEMI